MCSAVGRQLLMPMIILWYFSLTAYSLSKNLREKCSSSHPSSFFCLFHLLREGRTNKRWMLKRRSTCVLGVQPRGKKFSFLNTKTQYHITDRQTDVATCVYYMHYISCLPMYSLQTKVSPRLFNASYSYNLKFAS